MEGDWLEAGLALEGVTFDGVLRVGGRFMAGMAKHRSAEPDSLVVRVGEEELAAMLAERGDVYYVTDYYRGHGVVLVRLGMLATDTLAAVANGVEAWNLREEGIYKLLN